MINTRLDEIFGIIGLPFLYGTDETANVGTSFEGELRLKSGHDRGTILDIHIKELGHENQGNSPASNCCQPDGK